MKLLVVGSGGREHALAWKLAQSPRIQVVYVAPGNGGTALDERLHNVPITDLEALADFVEKEQIAFTLVGPETPLAGGIVNLFRARGLKIFGPTREAAQLESSKDFAKAFMKRHSIPTAEYETFTDAAAAHAYIALKGAPIVIKADGLAAGKGVVVAQTLEEAHGAVDMMLSDNSFGDAGARVVIEEFLSGEEASFIVMVDGKNVLPMATSQDHKRVGDGDTGPNTGGMGAYSPAPVVTAQVHQRVMDLVIWPTVRGMADEGNVYTGFLYAGLMIDKAGNPKVIEFNCRFGDPETQPVMLRLQSSLVLLVEAALAQALDKVEAQWDPRPSVGIVLAAGGYPADYAKGDVIEGLDAAATLEGKVFHAGTALKDGKVVTAGGRVLCATAMGTSVDAAQQQAYKLAAKIDWQGCFYRKDIGYRAIARERGEDQ